MEKIKTDNKEEKKTIEKSTIKNEAEPKTEINNEVAEMMKAMELMKKQMAAQEELIKKQGEALANLAEGKSSNSNGNNAELISLLKGLQNNANNQPTMNMVKVTCLEDCGGAQFRLQNGMVIKYGNIRIAYAITKVVTTTIFFHFTVIFKCLNQSAVFISLISCLSGSSSLVDTSKDIQ